MNLFKFKHLERFYKLQTEADRVYNETGVKSENFLKLERFAEAHLLTRSGEELYIIYAVMEGKSIGVIASFCRRSNTEVLKIVRRFDRKIGEFLKTNF